jgi:hypothetical protein
MTQPGFVVGQNALNALRAQGSNIGVFGANKTATRAFIAPAEGLL